MITNYFRVKKGDEQEDSETKGKRKVVEKEEEVLIHYIFT